MTIEQKVRALLATAVAAGATPGAQEAAVSKARRLVEQGGLNPADFRWPRKAARTASGPSRGTSSLKHPKRREAELLAMLRRSKGATIDEMVAAFGVKPHSARAMVSVFGRKAGGVERREGRYYIR